MQARSIGSLTLEVIRHSQAAHGAGVQVLRCEPLNHERWRLGGILQRPVEANPSLRKVDDVSHLKQQAFVIAPDQERFKDRCAVCLLEMNIGMVIFRGADPE